MTSHILTRPDFWETFVDEIAQKKTWKCNFPENVLYKNLDEDSKLYEDDTILKLRRTECKKWMTNDTLWTRTVLGACKEIAQNSCGPYSSELSKYKMLETLRDFVEHIHYFYETKLNMEARGEKIVVNAQEMSTIHDVDKLDPVMLVGYAERFEDNKTTSLWDMCVDRHVHTNPHHQQHCVWHDCCEILDDQSCHNMSEAALREMVCDKVSRRIQKSLNGELSEDMWNVDSVFYKGLPEPWLSRSNDLMDRMKNKGC